MRILATFPGKFGDLLWALPSLRALSRRIGQPVDLLVAAPFASICPLIEAQEYIGRCRAQHGWDVLDTAPMTPRIPQMYADPLVRRVTYADGRENYDAILHLGYRGWPQRPLPYETLDCLNAQLPLLRQIDAGVEVVGPITDEELALDEPWIVPTQPGPPVELVWGFTDEHFELKVGLITLLQDMLQPWVGIAPADGRWAQERPHASYPLSVGDWAHHARTLRNADVALCCCSALHVLAVAVGTPVVCMEPNPHRHNDVFYPLGKTGWQVRLVLGNDGLPTWDARAVRAAIEEGFGG